MTIGEGEEILAGRPLRAFRQWQMVQLFSRTENK